MGQTCSCSDDVDNEGEVKKGNMKKNKSQAGAPSTAKKAAKPQKISEIEGTQIRMTPDLKKRIKDQGLSYVEELVFDNGSIYQGYMKSKSRHGPGT
jgi:hypothetical protein